MANITVDKKKYKNKSEIDNSKGIQYLYAKAYEI